MKKLLLSIMAMVALTITLKAQIPTYGSQNLGTWTNALGSVTNLASPPTIICTKQARVTVGILSSAQGATNVTGSSFFFRRSIDGVNYDGLGGNVAFTAGAGTNYLTVTNLDSAGCGYIKIFSVTNAATDEGLTNTFFYAVKISSP